jgi:hypothetical protein
VEGKQMSRVEKWQKKTAALNSQLVDTLVAFAEANPDIPVQIMTAALGELLVNFSVSQVGTANTSRLLDYLKEAVEGQGQKIAPQH